LASRQKWEPVENRESGTKVALISNGPYFALPRFQLRNSAPSFRSANAFTLLCGGAVEKTNEYHSQAIPLIVKLGPGNKIVV